MFADAGAGLSTLSRCRYLNASQLRCEYLEQLISAIKLLQADRNKVFAYLNDPTLQNLMAAPSDSTRKQLQRGGFGGNPLVTVTATDVDVLFDETEAGSAVLAHLKILESNRRHFDKFEQLVSAVKAAEVLRRRTDNNAAKSTKLFNGETATIQNGENPYLLTDMISTS